MRRGDLVVVAVPGDRGKPRPAIVIQSDELVESESVLVVLVSSDDTHTPQIRLALPAIPRTGLGKPSYVMVEKITTSQRGKVGGVIGSLNRDEMEQLNRMLSLVIGLGDDAHSASR